MISQFAVEPYVKAWSYRACKQLTEGEFIAELVAKIEELNLRVETIKDIVMIFHEQCPDGNGKALIDAIVAKYPKYEKPLFTTLVSALYKSNQPDAILAAVEKYEQLYGRDNDSAGAKLNAYLMKGYEQNAEAIAGLMAVLEGSN